jgi:trypsin
MKQLLLIFLFFFIALSSAIEESRIVGGVDADIREFPYIVSIMNLGKHHCAGSLLNVQWVLSAAHCYLPANQTTIRYGATSVHLGNTALVDLFIQHENFNIEEIRNDIGLIRLKEAIRIEFHESFVKIPLPGISIESGVESTVAGWGIWDYSNMTTTPSLQKANLKIWSWRECRKAHEANPFNLKIYRSNICAAAKDFSSAECNG